MQFPESWLRELCNPPLNTAELADLLTMAGMEVESLRPAAPLFSNVVVGQVVSCEPHPQADRLKVCRVDVGSATPLQIVCGAPNVRSGIKVPCARVGAVLPPAEEGGPAVSIGPGLLRGVESQGMLCSARELKLLQQDADGLLVLSDDAPVGQDVRAHLQLDDTLFTLKLTPNLGHCLSLHGVAREVAALTGAALCQSPTAPVVARHTNTLPVTIEALDLCGRFSGRIVHGVNARAATPAWLAERLLRCGQRPVTALVDISNYVMIESGQPSHLFDFDRINGGLHVRWARAGETLKLLNGSTVALDAQVGVIVDDAAVESLAGVMGGDATAVSDATRNIYIETAFWQPDAIAGRARRLQCTSEAAHRFERGVDPAQTVAQLERITQLVLEICGGEPGPVDDQVIAVPTPAPLSLRVARAEKIIGMPVTQLQCADVFDRLGLAFTQTPGVLTVSPPSWRFDLRIEEDLIEEVIRVIGFDSLPATRPLAPLAPMVRSEARRGVHALRQCVSALDYVETINFSFVEERWERELAGNADPVRVLNPIASPLAVMRSSLLGSLVAVLRHNLARQASRVRIFEVGRVFLRDAAAAAGERDVAGLRQPQRVAGLAFGPVDPPQWASAARPVDFFDVKGDVEALFAPLVPVFVATEHPALHPGRCARVEVAGVAVGIVGELHPRWRQAYELPQPAVLFELDLTALLARPLPQPAPLARQQSVWRDIAVIVGPAVTHDALIDAARRAGQPLLRHVALFDVYQPAAPSGDMAAGERSLALRLELLDESATLTDQRSEACVVQVVAALGAEFGARLRR